MVSPFLRDHDCANVIWLDHLVLFSLFSHFLFRSLFCQFKTRAVSIHQSTTCACICFNGYQIDSIRGVPDVDYTTPRKKSSCRWEPTVWRFPVHRLGSKPYTPCIPALLSVSMTDFSLGSSFNFLFPCYLKVIILYYDCFSFHLNIRRCICQGKEECLASVAVRIQCP